MAHVHVKVLGMVRLNTGLHELDAEAKHVHDLFPLLLKEARKAKPDTTVTKADLEGCIVLINQKQSKKDARLSNGDTVYLMTPVVGG